MSRDCRGISLNASPDHLGRSTGPPAHRYARSVEYQTTAVGDEAMAFRAKSSPRRLVSHQAHLSEASYDSHSTIGGLKNQSSPRLSPGAVTQTSLTRPRTQAQEHPCPRACQPWPP